MVYHILKDGRVVEDISGHVVKMGDAEGLYCVLDSINKNRSRKSNQERKK